MVVTMPKDRDDFSGRYIFLPRVFCSSGMGQVSIMSSLYTKRGRLSLGCSPVKQLATWMEQKGTTLQQIHIYKGKGNHLYLYIYC